MKPSPQQRFGAFSGGPGSSDPGRITYESKTLENLSRDAYHLQSYQISGSSWLTSEHYTVAAKLPPDTTIDQYRQMMANLLAERFGVVSHRVVKDFAGYEITIAPGGIKLTPVAKTDSSPRSIEAVLPATGATEQHVWSWIRPMRVLELPLNRELLSKRFAILRIT